MEVLSANPSKRLDVLVVDDDEAGLSDLTGSLERAGLRCGGASNGWKALETLMRGTLPSVVITDIRMPELDGIELAQRLARIEMPQQPEIIFISGNAELDHAVHAIRLRARDLLTKPIDLRRLIQIVKEVQLERLGLSPPMAIPSPQTFERRADAPAQMPEFDVNSMSAGVLKSLRSLHRARFENLPEGLPVEASWEILLDLYVSGLRKERTSPTAIGVSSGVSLTSALRRIQELEGKGMVARISDETDKRRAFVQLTEKGRHAVQSFIRAYVTSCRCSQLQSVG